MSHNLLALINCPDIQAQLIDLNECKPNPQDGVVLLPYLLDPVNRAGILNEYVSPGAGKLHNVDVVFAPRIGENHVATTLTKNCLPTEEAGMDSYSYVIDETKGVEVGEVIDFWKTARICEGDQSYLASRIRALLNVAARKMETEITNQAALLAGDIVTDGDSANIVNDVLQIATLGEDGKFTEDGLETIGFTSMNSGFCGLPAIFGYDKIWKYGRKAQALCCANSGVDLAKFAALNQAMFFASRRMPSALGDANGFLVVDTGSLFLLQYNRFEAGAGLNVQLGNVLTQGVITDPSTGADFNIKIYMEPCGEKLGITISTAFKVVSLPDNMFSGGDRLEGTNGIFKGTIVNPA